MRRHDRSPVRSGFTLIELLVVIAIIILLVALTSAAVIRLISTQQYYNTVTGLKLFSGKASTQWAAVTEQANRDTTSVQARTWIANWLAANPGQLPTAARAAYVQAMQVQAFPVTFNEALNPNNGLSAWPAYQTYLGNLGITGSSSATQPYEAGVCLYMALTMGPFNTGSTGDSFGSANVMTQPLGTGNAKVIIDGYQTPLGVSRTPTGLVMTSAGQDTLFGTSDDLVSTNLP